MKKHGLTLIELLIAVVLVGLIVMSLVSIQRFASYNIITSERRVQLQNEGYLILEHITKNTQNITVNPFLTGSPFIFGTYGQRVYALFRLNDNGTLDFQDDTDAGYVWTAATSNIGPACQNTPYSLCNCYPTDTKDFIIGPGYVDCYDGWQTLSYGKVANFSVTMSSNYTLMNINLTMRYDPANAAGIDNPEVNLTTSIHLPGVPAN